jgi:hypothetical protein
MRTHPGPGEVCAQTFSPVTLCHRYQGAGADNAGEGAKTRSKRNKGNKAAKDGQRDFIAADSGLNFP